CTVPGLRQFNTFLFSLLTEKRKKINASTLGTTRRRPLANQQEPRPLTLLPPL
ncbi:hypothetical protein L9F63_015759, partial [Diploptera punctata]